jgi:glycosyltransferase involved in cell wall biosynthesis
LRTDTVPPRVAVIDGASFVLPYDHGLVSGLARRGWRVTLFASRTRYNGEFLDALRGQPGVELRVFDVSGTVAPRWRGVANYLRLWAEVWRRRGEFDAVNLQFGILWPLELAMALLLGRRFVLTLHNAVPHGLQAARHRPTAWLLGCAGRAGRVIFPSRATQDDAVRRYGPQPHATVLPHGLLPVAPGDDPRPYGPPPAPEALVFWGNVLPYKGVELLLELARSPAWAARGLALEVHGAFAPGLRPLRDELRAAGVRVVDGFLDAAALRALFRRPVIFVMPYRRASQSGALYTLLHEGCRFLCSDTGDLGDMMRRHGLQGLLMHERSPDALLQALDRLQAEPSRWTAAFAAAQQTAGWEAALSSAETAYGLRKSPP